MVHQLYINIYTISIFLDFYEPGDRQIGEIIEV